MLPTCSTLRQSSCRSWVEKPRKKMLQTRDRFTKSTENSFENRVTNINPELLKNLFQLLKVKSGRDFLMKLASSSWKKSFHFSNFKLTSCQFSGIKKSIICLWFFLIYFLFFYNLSPYSSSDTSEYFYFTTVMNTKQKAFTLQATNLVGCHQSWSGLLIL